MRDTSSASASDWKYAIINVSNSLELLLKSILEREHWSLLFDDINKATKSALASGDFRSVEFGTAIKRVGNVVGLSLPRNDTDTLRLVRDLRNRLTHFTVSLDLSQVKSICATSIHLYLKYYKQIFREEDPGFVGTTLRSLGEFEDFVSARMPSIRETLNSADRPSAFFQRCPFCFQDSLILENGELHCLFCENEFEIEDIAYNSEGYGGPCPECDDGHLGFVLHNNEEGEFVCVACGFRSDRNYNFECARCGRVFWNLGDDPLCSDCWAEIMNDG